VECAATRPVFVGRLTMHGVARTVRIPFHVSLAPNAGSRNTVLLPKIDHGPLAA